LRIDVEGLFCIDKWEASLVEVLGSGEARPFSPYSTIDGRHVRAVSAPAVFPQGYISGVEASRACTASKKRLCGVAEWKQACRGPERKQFGYGDAASPGAATTTARTPSSRSTVRDGRRRR